MRVSTSPSSKFLQVPFLLLAARTAMNFLQVSSSPLQVLKTCSRNCAHYRTYSDVKINTHRYIVIVSVVWASLSNNCTERIRTWAKQHVIGRKEQEGFEGCCKRRLCVFTR